MRNDDQDRRYGFDDNRSENRSRQQGREYSGGDQRRQDERYGRHQQYGQGFNEDLGRTGYAGYRGEYDAYGQDTAGGRGYEYGQGSRRGRDYEYGPSVQGGRGHRGPWEGGMYRDPGDYLGDETGSQQRWSSQRNSTPKGYKRSDERLHEEVCEQLSRSGLDVSEVSVAVSDGCVTLSGTVDDRRVKHAIEDCADSTMGVQDVDNRITVRRSSMSSSGTTGSSLDDTSKVSSTKK